MDITGVHISLRNEKRLKGFAHIVLDDSFIVHGLKIIKGFRGFIISMPCRNRKDGGYHDIARPTCREFREVMEQTIREKYWEAVEKEREKQSLFKPMAILEECREP